MHEISFRPLQESDIEAILRLTGGAITRESLEFQANVPNLHPYDDFVVALNPEAQIIGLVLVGLQAYSEGGFLHLILHPAYITSVADVLLAHGCESLLKRADIEKGVDVPMWVYTDVPENHPYLIDILTRNDFQEARRFQHMAIRLDSEFEVQLPAGISIRPYEAHHARLIHQAEGDAFNDHWGNTQDIPFEVWAHQFSHPLHDDNLCFIAWDGDTVAGVSLCLPSENDPDVCHIETLSVRPAWRKRGLGLALLSHSFNAFYKAGYRLAELRVDTHSETSAQLLYARAGMAITTYDVQYRKILRGTEADVSV